MRKIAIIGGGPAGFMSAIVCKNLYPEFDITIFDSAKPLSKLLLTGGGRCNISNAIFDFKDLAKNYPRGEKFLYSIFSRFDVSDLFSFFEKAGVDLYIQEDNRIFPKTNDAKTIRGALLSLAQQKNIQIKPNFQIVSIKKIPEHNKFFLNETLQFDNIIIATGNTPKGLAIAEKLGHTIIPIEPTLCGMQIETPYPNLAGISTQIATAHAQSKEFSGDILFTHKGISGPMIMDISSVLAYEKLPLELELNFTGLNSKEQDKELLELLDKSPKKNIANLLNKYLPISVIEEFLKEIDLKPDKKACEISKEKRAKIVKFLTKKRLILTKKEPNFMVKAGGIKLDEVDKNLESKIVKGLYFAGEILDIDGLCGGFNLQACFSTGFVAGHLGKKPQKGDKNAKS